MPLKVIRGLTWLTNINRSLSSTLTRATFSDHKNNDQVLKESKNTERDLPPEPTCCCNSGCANCVWIKYAQEVTQLFDDGDIIAKNKISQKVQDPKLRAFLFTQLGLEGHEKGS